MSRMQHTAVVTGGTGFIGHHLVEGLLEQGWSVVLPIRSAARASDMAGHPRLSPVLLDGPNSLDGCFDSRPDVVYHLATHFVARHTSREQAAEMVAANVAFGTQVAEAALVRRTPLVTASSVWQHYQGAGYDPVSLYAATKQALDDILRYYSRVEGLGWTRVVLGDTYGPADGRGKLLTHLLRAVAEDRPFPAASGALLWEAVHVRDVVKALLFAGEEQIADSGPREYQLRPARPTTLRDVVAAVEQATGRTVDARWGLLPDRGREMLEPWVVASGPPGWSPQIDLVTGIRQIWEREFSPG